MTPRKLNRAFVLAGITMPTVRAHIERNMTAVAADLQSATAKQLAACIRLHHTAYTQGRTSCGACIEDDAVWVGEGVDKLIPLKALRAIVVEEKTDQIRQPYTSRTYPFIGSLRDVATGKYVDRECFDPANVGGYYSDEYTRSTRMTLDYTERF